jgi:hypothetical protein
MSLNSINYEQYRTKYDIDKKAHPDTEIVRFCGRDLPLGEVRKQYDNFNERKYKMFSFFDDVYQYTTLGLMDIIYDKYHVKTTLPIKDFFERKEIYGIDWLAANVAKYGLTKDDLLEIKKERYSELILRSPISKNIAGFFKMREILDGEIIVFDYPFNGIEEFVKKIMKMYGHSDFSPIQIEYLRGRTEKEYYDSIKRSTSRNQMFDVLACGDAQAFIDFANTAGIDDTVIMTNAYHNGIPMSEQYVYVEMFDCVGPRNCRLYYMADDIYGFDLNKPRIPLNDNDDE